MKDSQTPIHSENKKVLDTELFCFISYSSSRPLSLGQGACPPPLFGDKNFKQKLIEEL